MGAGGGRVSGVAVGDVCVAGGLAVVAGTGQARFGACVEVVVGLVRPRFVVVVARRLGRAYHPPVCFLVAGKVGFRSFGGGEVG